MKEQESNDGKLEASAPRLMSMERSNPFLVPENYFGKLADSIVHEIQENEIPLENRAAKQPFTVPDHYFEQLPAIIAGKTVTNAPRVRRIIILRPAFALSLAAAFLAVLLVTKPSLWFNATQQHELTALSSDELSSSAYFSDLDEHTLIDAIEKSDQASSATRNENSEMENYLIENHIELNQLTNEF